jgi:membrane fusion protein (multidrug efflux system)
MNSVTFSFWQSTLSRRASAAGKTIAAPIGGTAVNVKLQPGEQVRAMTPLFVVVAKTRPWVEANMKETDLTYVQPGQKAEVVLDIYPDVTWAAEVDSISPATGAEFAILPPQNASGNWVKVVQRVPLRIAFDKDEDTHLLRAGMSVVVDIDTGHSRLPFLSSTPKEPVK